MTSDARIRANRLNALRSTGPRTRLGKQRSSLNALSTGLFARHLVVSALGETATEFESFRRSVLADLAPSGAVERELCDRIAGILWRLRRVAIYEAAAMSTGIGPLPPSPDAITPDGIDDSHPSVADPAPAERLARVRSRLRALRRRRDEQRAGVEVLGCTDHDRTVDDWIARTVLRAAADVLDWMLVPPPWPAVFIAAGCPAESLDSIVWDVGGMLTVLRTAATRAARDPDGFVLAVSERLRVGAADAERASDEAEVEENQLVAEISAERSRVAAARIYSDDGFVQRIAKAEGHLGRELERSLALLVRLRAECPSRPGFSG